MVSPVALAPSVDLLPAQPPEAPRHRRRRGVPRRVQHPARELACALRRRAAARHPRERPWRTRPACGPPLRPAVGGRRGSASGSDSRRRDGGRGVARPELLAALPAAPRVPAGRTDRRRASRRVPHDPLFLSGVTGWATRAAYARLLDAAARIFEYRLPRKLHAKTWVIDGEWAVVGSANLDHLSLFVNLELVLAARDPDLGEALRAQYAVPARGGSDIAKASLTEDRNRAW